MHDHADSPVVAAIGRWDPERREFIIGVGHHALHVTDMALDDSRYDLDHLAAEFVGTFRGPEFERVRDGLRPGYNAMQAARTALRWTAIGSAIHDLTGLSTNDGTRACSKPTSPSAATAS